MNEAVRQMLDRHACRTRDDYLGALREILQHLALLGLWRSKFFEHAAFYGGTAVIMPALDNNAAQMRPGRSKIAGIANAASIIGPDFAKSSQVPVG